MHWCASTGCRAEAGGSAVSFVMVLPILMSLMCAIVDLGRLTIMEAELESATQTACGRMVDQIASSDSAAPNDHEVTRAVVDASPSLSSFGARCSATCRVSDAPSVSYQRHRFDSASGLFVDEDASMNSVEVQVSSTLEGDYLTPVGLVLSRDGGGTFSLSSQAVRTVLKTQGDRS